MSEENRLHIHGLSPGDVALLKDIAEAAADKSVSKMLMAMGLNPDRPIESQELFGTLRDLAYRVRDPELVKDAQWTRRVRGYSEGMIGKALVTAIGLVVVSAAHTLWVGAKAILGHAPP